MGQVEVDVVDDYQVEISIAVIVDEGATCAPALGGEQAAFFGLVAKRAISLIPVQNILSPLGDEHVGVAIIVDVTRTDTLAPPGTRDSRFFGDVFELQSTQIVIEERLGLRAVAQASAIHQQDVGETVIVVVENCYTGSGGFRDVLFSVVCPGNFNPGEASLDGDILVVNGGRLHARREWTGRDRGAPGGHALSARELTSAQNDQDKNEESGMDCES